MSKLLKLKKWLTLDEAANHISNVLGEPVTRADIYNFALDGHLVLSVNFVNIVKAKKVTFIKKEDIKYKRVRPKNLPNMPEGGHFNVPINAQQQITRDLWVESIESKVVSLSGVWDLSMIGTEKFSIKQLHQQEISSDIEVKIPEAMSVYVKGAKGIYELQLLLTMEQYRKQHNTPLVNGMRSRILDCALAYPASGLDELDYDLVVKVKEISRLIQLLEGTLQEGKPPAQKAYTKNIDKRIQGKANTKARYLSWQQKATELKEKHPNKSNEWIAKQIARLPIAQNRNFSTIKKNINI
jgi:hypothetical protein